MRSLLPVFFLTMVCLGGCSAGNDSSAVPRRRAFPRVQAPDTAFTQLTGLPLLMSVNESQPVQIENRADGSVWITVRYPAYDASILCTFTPVDESSIARVLDNRYERMKLNAGAGSITVREFENSGGYHSGILRSQAASATPVQFISSGTGSPQWVVSGSVFFEKISPSTSADSVRPVIDIMQGEVERMLISLANTRP